MQVKKKLKSGLIARELSTAEFYACVDYAVSNGRQYPLETMSLKRETVEQYSVPGYNALLDAGVFEIDDEGYPALTTNVVDMTDLILALDGMQSLLTIRLALGKHSLTFYYVHSDNEWAIMWKQDKTAWNMVAGTYTTPPAITLIELAAGTLTQADRAHVAVRYSFYNMAGQQVAITEIASTRRDGFVEQRPAYPALADGVDDWPQFYRGLGSMLMRATDILKVM